MLQLLSMSMMSVQSVVPVHRVDVEIFHWIIESFNLLLLQSEKSLGFFLCETLINIIFHGHPSSSCWEISVEPDWQAANLSSLPSSHTDSLANKNRLFNSELNMQQSLWHQEMLRCKEKWEKSWDCDREEKLHLQSEPDSWGEVRHEPCQLHGHAMVLLMNRFEVPIATLTFRITQSHSSYQGLLPPCNPLYLSVPQIWTETVIPDRESSNLWIKNHS